MKCPSVLLSVISIVALALTAQGADAVYEDVSLEQGHTMWQDGVYTLDVRTPSEYAAGHLPSAHNIPVSELEARLGEISINPATDILVYCLAGGRSAQASGILAGKSYTAVHNMLGGYDAWAAAGYESEGAGCGSTSKGAPPSKAGDAGLLGGVLGVLAMFSRKKK